MNMLFVSYERCNETKVRAAGQDISTKCVMPGGKRSRGELPQRAIQRVLALIQLISMATGGNKYETTISVLV